ncbi:MAG: hypothetical protein IJ693_07855 [Bacteroidaceae bacterium]|nr:hypothetical protein [Bacteroidaceae bacterium]
MKRRLFVAVALLMGLLHSIHADNWMTRLPDDAYVAVVSIPGTHDSATGCGWARGRGFIGDMFARTQDINIQAQWHIGIRAFDFRPSVYKNYMNLNHGIMPTNAHFEDVLCMLRDSLIANPSEFVVIHLLHAGEGDKVKNAYNTRLMEILKRADLKDFFVDFKTDLKVRDVRGKMLILSRNNYSNTPVGGIFQNWTGGVNWFKQIQGRIVGSKNEKGIVYMQDFSDTHHEGGVQIKIAAINKMLDYSTTHTTTTTDNIRWILNFASAYSKVMHLFGYEISTSKGYRDNAAYTHAAFLQYLKTHNPGPTGIVLMDYAGVDKSDGYDTNGLQLVRAIINNNFKYLSH